MRPLGGMLNFAVSPHALSPSLSQMVLPTWCTPNRSHGSGHRPVWQRNNIGQTTIASYSATNVMSSSGEPASWYQMAAHAWYLGSPAPEDMWE